VIPGIVIFTASVLTLAGIYAILAMVLNLEAGFAGLWDLGTAGLFAVGGYFFLITTAGEPGLTFSPGWPMWAGILGAGVFTGAIAFLIGIPALRLRGEYFLITTFAFAEVIRQVITNEPELTRGAAGFNQIVRPLDDLTTGRNYTFVLLGIVALVVVAVWLVVRAILQSREGRTLRALRDNEAAALAAGIPVHRHRAATFTLAGILLGLTAPLYIWYLRSITPHVYAPEITFTAWTALVLGGIGSLRGPIVGAVLLIVVTHATIFLQVSPEYAELLASLRPIVIGLVLIVILRFHPQGLISEKTYRSRRQAASSAATVPEAQPEARAT
jgi:branched-chain amino acid transport system permease protein